MVEKFEERMGIAYHEAGHSVIGYIHGHTTNFIDINLDIARQIYPNVDKSFGVDEEIIKQISELDIIALKQRQCSDLLTVAEKYCIGLLAGTFAELWYLKNSHPQKFEHINQDDQRKIRNCINVIYSVIGEDFNRNQFINMCLNKTRDLVCDEVNFNKMKQVADALITSKRLRLERYDIESIVK